MKILITGGTGFIGTALCQQLLQKNHDISVLSRHPKSVQNINGKTINTLAFEQLKPDDNWQAIINLAGAPIFASRWTDARKQIMRDSRIKLTLQLVEYMAKMDNKPQVFLSGSAIGYYGNQGDQILTEQSTIRRDFSQQLCQDWEAAALQAQALGIRVCLIRTGLVIAEHGGLLQRMLPAFKLCLGGPIGDGRQWMSWIHRQDWLNIAELLLNSELQGAFNATAPNPVTNNEFTQTLANRLHRPAILPMPASFLKLLLGEMSELVLGSQRVLPERLLVAGYKFQYTELNDALTAAL